MNSIKIVKKRGEYDLYLTFFSNKVEKIVSAIYLVTEHLSQEESLKWQLRKNGMRLLSKTVSLSESDLSYKDKILSDIKRAITEVILLLEVSLTAKIITEMNIEIFKRELDLLLKIINNSSDEIGQRNLLSLKGDFFKVKGGNLDTGQMLENKEVFDKGHNKGHREMSFRTATGVNNKVNNAKSSKKKQSRKDQILKLFNKGQKLTIKDISEVVDDCGEKTIQRELKTMLKDGVIDKEGERRWSVYFLKS